MNPDHPPQKIPYIPSEKKRYEVSRDEYSTRRIEALRDIQHTLQKELPIPISISIFGSLIKGKVLTADNAENADIDCNILFDQNALEKLSNEEKNKLHKILIIFGEHKQENPIKQSEEEISKIKDYIKKRFTEELEKRGEELKLKKIDENNIFVNTINYESIYKAVHWRRLYAGEGNDDADLNISLFFTLSIGTAVKKYRNEFLKMLTLPQNKKVAESFWDTIKNAVEKTERKGEIPESIKHRFPQTLAEALKFYGIKE